MTEYYEDPYDNLAVIPLPEIDVTTAVAKALKGGIEDTESQRESRGGGLREAQQLQNEYRGFRKSHEQRKAEQRRREDEFIKSYEELMKELNKETIKQQLDRLDQSLQYHNRYVPWRPMPSILPLLDLIGPAGQDGRSAPNNYPNLRPWWPPHQPEYQYIYPFDPFLIYDQVYPFGF
ncbi:MAG: hypothetical protein MN733_05140 [Nitrososphaera sp.]|nr:hypothetical protein [Nitrososphaera sp.]